MLAGFNSTYFVEYYLRMEEHIVSYKATCARHKITTFFYKAIFFFLMTHYYLSSVTDKKLMKIDKCGFDCFAEEYWT